MDFIMYMLNVSPVTPPPDHPPPSGMRVQQKELLKEITSLYNKYLADPNYHKDLKKKNFQKFNNIGQNKISIFFYKNL